MPDMLDLIIKKRDGGKLGRNDIDFFINGITADDIPDYQTSALLMAVYFNGLDEEETFELTRAIAESGEQLDLSGIEGIKVDKHSTGGVGDKITPIAVPIAAAAGVPVAKMSGRGLGYTGGTADKMESIPGFRTQMTTDELIKQVRDTGAALVTHTASIAPADRKLYALRDVTGTVANRSLIASSIMGKKIASGSDVIVLDVKCGNGAFFRDEKAAEDVVDLMMDIGRKFEKRTVAVISDMNRPLGKAVGNSLEIMEAIDVLKGRGPADVEKVALTVAGAMIYAGGKAASLEDAETMAGEILRSGAGLAKLREIIARQGGDPRVTEDLSLFGSSRYSRAVTADVGGFITETDTAKLGMASQVSGAGRLEETDMVDPNAGIMVMRTTGDEVHAGDELAMVYSSDEEKLDKACRMAKEAYTTGKSRPAERKLIKKIVGF